MKSMIVSSVIEQQHTGGRNEDIFGGKDAIAAEEKVSETATTKKMKITGDERQGWNRLEE